MMLFSELIRAISKKSAVVPIHISDKFNIDDSALIDGRQEHFQNGVLYFGYYAQVAGQELPAHCVLAGAPPRAAEAQADRDLALAEEGELFFLFNLSKSLIEASRSPGLYTELMDCAARTGSVSAFIDLAASRLGSPVVLVDRDFKVLAFSSIYPIDDPIWAQNVRQGYCCYEFVSAVGELESVKRAPDSSEPVLVTCSASPSQKLSSKVFWGGEMIGYVIALEGESSFGPAHFEQLALVSAASGDMLARYAPYLLPDGTQYQRLLYDLLIGAPPEKLAPVIAKLRFPEKLCALRLSQDGGQGQKRLRQQVAEKLRALFPGSQMTFHENGIAALLAPDGPCGPGPEQFALLCGLAEDEQLSIGVSNAFGEIADFARHYARARRALELAAKLKLRGRVCRYADLAFYDLVSAATKKDGLERYVHPALALLRRYDEENGAELLRTLERFLACDCSLKLASEALFIHRNSLAYRLGRIGELTGLDLADSGTRFLLNLSFAIGRFGECT